MIDILFQPHSIEKLCQKCFLGENQEKKFCFRDIDFCEVFFFSQFGNATLFSNFLLDGLFYLRRPVFITSKGYCLIYGEAKRRRN